MAFNSVETKWNADDEKLHMLMEIEANLENAFIDNDLRGIYKYLGAYRRHSVTKFGTTDQNSINENFNELTEKFNKVFTDKDIASQTNFYSYAEGLFLTISQKLKEAGVYYRENKSAQHAILHRN
jgi:hypothetical protein